MISSWIFHAMTSSGIFSCHDFVMNFPCHDFIIDFVHAMTSLWIFPCHDFIMNFHAMTSSWTLHAMTSSWIFPCHDFIMDVFHAMTSSWIFFHAITSSWIFHAMTSLWNFPCHDFIVDYPCHEFVMDLAKRSSRSASNFCRNQYYRLHPWKYQWNFRQHAEIVLWKMFLIWVGWYIHASLNRVIICSGNGLSTFRPQDITSTNADLISTGSLGTTFRKKIDKIHNFHSMKCICKCRRQEWQTSCLVSPISTSPDSNFSVFRTKHIYVIVEDKQVNKHLNNTTQN